MTYFGPREICTVKSVGVGGNVSASETVIFRTELRRGG